MSCEYFEDLIVRMPDGELSEAELNALLAHIDSCADCRALFHAVNAVHDELCAPVEAPDTLCGRVMDAIAREAKPAQPRQGQNAHAKRRRWRYADFAIMAACAALVVSILGVSQLSPRYNATADSAAMLTAEAGLAATETASTEDALPAEDESAPLLGAALSDAENGAAAAGAADTGAETAAAPQATRNSTADAADTGAEKTRSTTANTADAGAQEADSAAELPMDAAAPELAVMPGVAAAAPDGADVFDKSGGFAGFLPSDALDRLLAGGDAESVEPDGEPDFRIERSGVSYELFVLDGALYWRETGGALHRAGMDAAEFSGYLG